MPDYPVEWIIPPSEVITFDIGSQTARGVAPGTAVITATGAGESASATITVAAVGSVEIDPERATLSVGETLTLEVTVYDTEGNELPDYPVEWTIPPGEIIAFDPITQTVRGVSPGTAEITATCDGKSASATITVVKGTRYILTWEVTVQESLSYGWTDEINYLVIYNNSYEVDAHWVGSAEVVISGTNHTVLWCSTEGYYHMHEKRVQTWHCDGGRSYIITDEIMRTITDAATEYVKEYLYIRVRKYTNGSLYIRNPFPRTIPVGVWWFKTFTVSGWTCYADEPQNSTSTDQGESGFPSLGFLSLGDLNADDATGQSFSKKKRVVAGLWWYQSIHADWDVRVEVKGSSSLSTASLVDSQMAYASPYTDIDIPTAHDMITNNGYPDILVLDVRTQSEYDSGHIHGAVWIPVTELEARISELAVHENHDIIVYCRSGVRSLTASEILDSHGFSKVYNMLGGISAWQSAGYPLNPEQIQPSHPLRTRWLQATEAAGIAVLIGAVYFLKKRKSPIAPPPPTEGTETSIK